MDGPRFIKAIGMTEAERLEELAHAEQKVREWQATVEVLRDPELVAELSRGIQELDEVPE